MPRNVGNVVCNTDMNFLTCLNYAVNVLKVPHIIVCGHYDCGAVRGSLTEKVNAPSSSIDSSYSPILQDMGPGVIENWLLNIRDVRRLHQEELDLVEDSELKHRLLVELHVREQALNVLKTGRFSLRIKMDFPLLRCVVQALFSAVGPRAPR